MNTNMKQTRVCTPIGNEFKVKLPQKQDICRRNNHIRGEAWALTFIATVEEHIQGFLGLRPFLFVTKYQVNPFMQMS